MTRALCLWELTGGEKAARFYAAPNLAQPDRCSIILKFACPDSGAANSYS